MNTKTNVVPFHNFQTALQAQFAFMQTLGELYTVDIAKDELYDFYLDAFPAGTNEVYKERREYDCNCCKSFIRSAGRVVAIHNNKLVSIWDVAPGGYYDVVAKAMKDKVESAKIADRFFHFEGSCGNKMNVSLDENGKSQRWEHFQVDLPRSVVKTDGTIAQVKGELRSQKDVLFRALTELELHAGETVLDLIAQGSLYRGDEQKRIVETFVRLKREFDKVPTTEECHNFAWVNAAKLGDAAKFRNNAIGTLLINLSEGKDLESAVGAWEVVMAPSNYKRTTALVTPAMIRGAQEKVAELGLEDSLARRYAVETDLTINNVLFADRSSKVRNNVFDELVAENKGALKSLDKVEEISIADFINKVLPTTKSIEVLVENRLTPNFMSLIAPINAAAPNMLKWDNNFSWSYNGEVTDSIKERVKAAGGSVTGDMRVSLAWSNPDDLDLHVFEPGGRRIYHGAKQSPMTGGTLDVDMNAFGTHDAHNPVENVTWANASKIPNGEFVVVVKNYNKRLKDRIGFTIQVEYKGQVFEFHHAADLGDGKDKEIVRFKHIQGKGIEIGKSIGYSKQSREVWGINTEQFQKASLVLNSPNFWDGQEKGNKHYFFILEGCVNPDDTRGFYNEYLRDELHEHRKVFELLSSKLKAEHTTEQLSGLGFSVSSRNELTVKVTGSFTRTLKIKF